MLSFFNTVVAKNMQNLQINALTLELGTISILRAEQLLDTYMYETCLLLRIPVETASLRLIKGRLESV